MRREAQQRYAAISELLSDLHHLDRVTPVDYVPALSKPVRRYWPALRVILIIVSIFLMMLAFGVFAQLAHHVH